MNSYSCFYNQTSRWDFRNHPNSIYIKLEPSKSGKSMQIIQWNLKAHNGQEKDHDNGNDDNSNNENYDDYLSKFIHCLIEILL